jgi:CheY-like chemotaxis protein
MGEQGGPRIVALVGDLFFAVRIRETLRPHGYAVDVVKSAAALGEAVAGEPPALVIVDLAFRALDPPGRIAALKADAATAAIPVLAFGSHLDQAAREAARAAGADRVIANSKLADDLPALVARYARPMT